MPKHFTHKKRATNPSGPGPGRPRARPDAAPERRQEYLSHEELAALLWSADYRPLFDAEAARHADLSVLIDEFARQHASTYQQRELGGVAARQRHAEAVGLAEQSIGAQVRRLGNQRDIPLLVAARSLSWLMAMARSKQWMEERKLKRLVDRTTAMKLVKRMTVRRAPALALARTARPRRPAPWTVTCRLSSHSRPPPPRLAPGRSQAIAPAPTFGVNPFVKVGFVDQTYLQNLHYGSRRHVRVERLEADGLRAQTHFEVFVNSVALPVPSTLARLDAAALREIVPRGPYTEDPTLALLPALQPALIRHHQRGFLLRSSARLLEYARAAGSAPTALTQVEITTALLCRPSTDPGGKTYLRFLPVLPSTDTKSYVDLIKIVAHLTKELGAAIVLVVLGDGQTVLRLRDLKKKYGAAYRHVLIANGHFHSFAHFMLPATRCSTTRSRAGRRGCWAWSGSSRARSCRTWRRTTTTTRSSSSRRSRAPSTCSSCCMSGRRPRTSS